MGKKNNRRKIDIIIMVVTSVYILGYAALAYAGIFFIAVLSGSMGGVLPRDVDFLGIVIEILKRPTIIVAIIILIVAIIHFSVMKFRLKNGRE